MHDQINRSDGRSAAASSHRQAGWAQGVPLVAQSALPTLGAMLLVPVVPLIAAEFGHIQGASYLIPSLLTVPSLCIALFSILAGVIGDRFGRRRLLIGALAIYGLVGAAPLLLKSFEAVLAARIGLGVCEAVIITLSATMLGDYYTGKTRDRWLALISTVASLSAVVFLITGGAIGAAFGWRAATAVYGISLLIVPAMLLLTWEPSAHHAEASSAVRASFPWRHIAATGAVTLLGSIYFYTMAIQQGAALTALGVVDPARIGLLSAIASLANPIGTLVFWRVSHLRPASLLAGEFLLIGLAFAGMGHAASDVQFTLFAFAGLFGAGLLLPTLITWTMRGLPFEVRARGTGIWQTLFALGQFISGLTVPFLARNVASGVLPAFGLLGLVALVIGATALAIRLLAKPPVPADA